MTGTWTSEAHTAPFGAGLMLLLTDGSVLANEEGGADWWRLQPDRAGRYRTGEWRRTSDSAGGFPPIVTAVLPDGSVFLVSATNGGASGAATSVFTVEAYDPLDGKWRSIQGPPKGWGAIGPVPCCVLPDGRVLLGLTDGASCAIFHPSDRSWTATDRKQVADTGRESWTLLADGTVLAVGDKGRSVAAERFSGNSWYPAGDDVVGLADLRPGVTCVAVLLNDGSVAVVGPTGASARCTPSPDPTLPSTWTAGPPPPKDASGVDLGGEGAPACLLPTGRVLHALGPFGRAAASVAASFFEYDPKATGTWSKVLSSPGAVKSTPPIGLRFLMLPNRRVLVSDGTRTLRTYDPGPDLAGWAPTVRSCAAVLSPGTVNLLVGTGFNGNSQACVSASGASMATNYPLVRLAAAFPSDSVAHCRTGGHSTMAVATGRQETCTDFAIPEDLKPGTYRLSVVANGVASVEMTVKVAAGHFRRRGRRAERGVPDGHRVIFGEEELFERDLSEVHLLIDYISGRTDKSLSLLKDVCGFDANGNEVASMSAQKVIEEICKISYPPAGSLEATAQQASFMLMVKDKLNELVDPARGLTVAFTAMFAGIALEYPAPTAFGPVSKPMFFSALAAYPNLEKQARKFRNFCYRLPVTALFLVLFIVYANWDISVTGTILHQLSDADTSYAKLFTSEHGFLPTAASCAALSGGSVPTTQQTAGGGTATQGTTDAATEAHRVACDAAEEARAQRMAGVANLQALGGNLWFLRPVALSLRLFGPPPGLSNRSKEKLEAIPSEAENAFKEVRALRRSSLESFTLAIVGGLTGIVIPTGFGLLGTLVGLMRTITLKTRDNILAPRDHQVARVALFLGMSAGLSVGLFFNAADPGGDIAKGIGNTITVSAAGLSFLAGFGAEAFFAFLDGVLLRLFPVAARKS